MFEKSAQFYDAIYRFKNYEAASAQIRLLVEKHLPSGKSLLDVGCGTGQHLRFLKDFYEVEGLDINPDLLAVAQKKCPEVPFHRENMIEFDLGKCYDAVICLFSSIAYVKTEDKLERAIQSMANHLNPGGLLLVEPWVSPEQYWRNKVVANFVDEPELKISWMYKHEIDGDVSVFNIHYLVGTPESVEHFTERHEMGLFTVEQYTAAFQKAGLSVEYDTRGPFGRGMYLGRKGSSPIARGERKM